MLSTVNCSATVCHYVADTFPKDELAAFGNVDGIVALTHGTGCGMADSGDGFAALQRTLWGYARHPNFAGVLMIGLGCEVNQIDFLLDAYQIKRGPHFRTMTMQGTGGTRKTVERAQAMIREILPHANEATRQPISASELSVALQCGGSDAYSGITANPALGAACDILVRHGGTGILAETPEIYGAEHLLTRRAVSTEVGEKLVERIKWWEDYCARNGGEMNNNPSPGNKAGGLTTILEKSLGAAAKGGTTNLTGVYKYAEPVTARGFTFMDSPGYDPGLGHRPGRVRRQPRLLHDRPRLVLRLQARALDQARDQHRDVPAHGRGHGRQLRRDPGRRGERRADGPAHFRIVPRGRLGPPHQVRRAGPRQPRVHPLADRRRHVGSKTARGTTGRGAPKSGPRDRSRSTSGASVLIEEIEGMARSHVKAVTKNLRPADGWPDGG